MTIFKKATLALALGASALAAASPAMARDYRRHGGDDTAAVAVGVGILGLAIGALVASGNNRHDRDFRSRGWEYRNGYYWDRQGRRYDRDGRHYTEDRYYARRGYRDDYYNRGY